MSETLVLEIGADGRTVTRAGLVSEDRGWLQSVAVDSLVEHRGQPVVLVFNGTLVASQNVSVPAFTEEKLLKVLPGLVEGGMGFSGEQRHYAVMGQRDDATGNCPVAVMAFELLQGLLAEAQTLGLNVVKVVPDYCLVDREDEQEVAVSIDGRVLARRPDGTGFAVEQDVADLMLNDGVTARPMAEDDWRASLAGAASVDENLLQGAFGPRADISSWFLWFRRASVLAVLAFLLWGGSVFYQASENFDNADALHAETEQAFREALPGVKRIVNMETQMRRAILGMRQQGGSEFLVLSSLAVKAIAANEATTLESMRFDGEESALMMELSFASFASGEAFKTELQRLGLQVTEGGSRSEGGRVFSELTIRRQV